MTRTVTPKNLKNTEKRNEDSVNGINLKNHENIEKALKRFKKVIDRAGVVYDVKNYRHYIKPSVKKREALKAAKRKKQRDSKWG